MRHPLVTFILLLALALSTYFSWQILENSRLFRDLTDNERPIETWMSPRMVAHSWDLSRSEMQLVMRIDSDSNALPSTIADVLERKNMSLEELKLRVDTVRECDDFDLFDFDRDEFEDEQNPQLKIWQETAFTEICGDDHDDD